jgi:hypothetical protein
MGLDDEIETALRRRGHVQAVVCADEEADEWRNAARAAALRLGRSIETMQHRHVVVAALKDWPANKLEQQVQDAALRAAMNRIADLPS